MDSDSDYELEDFSLPEGYIERFWQLSVGTRVISVRLQSGNELQVHPEILLNGSNYFEKLLGREPSCWADKGPINLDFISLADFGLYLSVVYAMYICSSGLLQLSQVSNFVGGRHVFRPWPRILTLYKLGRFFGNASAMKIAMEGLDTRIGEYSIDNWQLVSTDRPTATLTGEMLRLQEAWRICREYELPFRHEFVKAAGDAPPRLFWASLDVLQDREPYNDEIFVVDVAKYLQRRHGNSSASTMRLPELPRVAESATRPWYKGPRTRE